MDWICGELTAVVDAGPDAKICRWLVAPSELAENFTDPTLMTFNAWFAAEFATTVGQGDILGLGAIVWNFVDDTDPDAANCPGPVSNCDFDWLWLYYAVVAGSTNPAISSPFAERDRKSDARRKLGNDKAILLVAETNAGAPNATNVHVHARALIKE